MAMGHPTKPNLPWHRSIEHVSSCKIKSRAILYKKRQGKKKNWRLFFQKDVMVDPLFSNVIYSSPAQSKAVFNHHASGREQSNTPSEKIKERGCYGKDHGGNRLYFIEWRMPMR
jgi:hypothetical protein